MPLAPYKTIQYSGQPITIDCLKCPANGEFGTSLLFRSNKFLNLERIHLTFEMRSVTHFIKLLAFWNSIHMNFGAERSDDSNRRRERIPCLVSSNVKNFNSVKCLMRPAVCETCEKRPQIRLRNINKS